MFFPRVFIFVVAKFTTFQLLRTREKSDKRRVFERTFHATSTSNISVRLRMIWTKKRIFRHLHSTVRYSILKSFIFLTGRHIPLYHDKRFFLKKPIIYFSQVLDKGWVPLPVLDEVRERPQLVLWSTILVGRGGPRIINQNLKISLKNYIFLKK